MKKRASNRRSWQTHVVESHQVQTKGGQKRDKFDKGREQVKETKIRLRIAMLQNNFLGYSNYLPILGRNRCRFIFLVASYLGPAMRQTARNWFGAIHLSIGTYSNKFCTFTILVGRDDSTVKIDFGRGASIWMD